MKGPVVSDFQPSTWSFNLPAEKLATILDRFALSITLSISSLTCVTTGLCCWIGWAFSGHSSVPDCILKKDAAEVFSD